MCNVTLHVTLAMLHVYVTHMQYEKDHKIHKHKWIYT